jgi:hypothetical protein
VYLIIIGLIMMKLKKVIKMETMIIIAICSAIGAGWAYFSNTDDSAVEEAVEIIIEDELGVPPGTIDLTPNSKESRNV